MDSYVFESNVHFPTDYNLLWDCNRKCIELISKLTQQLGISGWRKKTDWLRQLKNQMRAIGRISQRGGTNKDRRMKIAVRIHLKKSRQLSEKVEVYLEKIKRFNTSETGLLKIIEIEYYYHWQQVFIKQLHRRVIEGQTIPTEEKIYSVFEEHTEWINKGKFRPTVELGHRLQISTDQNKLIVDYKVLEKESEVDQPLPTVKRILEKLEEEKLGSLSTDKGYSRKTDREELEKYVEELVIPKKGKKNKAEKERESAKSYRKLRHKHNAVESQINSLEHHGLNRCPDKGLHGYKRYVGLGVLSYNLHQIGKELQERERAAHKKRKCA